MILLAISCWVSLTTAISFDHAPQAPQPTETLLVDMRVPVLHKRQWFITSHEEHDQLLHRRANDDNVTTTIEIRVSTTTSEPTTTTIAASPLPSPFDSALAANFTGNSNGACPIFINAFLTNSTFKQCYPFSVLLQGSRSFFEAEKSLVSITQVLDASCKVDVNFCDDYLNNLATDLIKEDNCKEDYELQNQVVVQAYLGLRAYQPLYSATCLTDPDTSAYCFANAVTNLTTPSNVYFYYMPLNLTFPGSAVPSCNWCTQQTMGIFQSATANRKQMIANTYADAAVQVNTVCGPGFVNETLPEATVESAALSMHQPPSVLLLSFLIMALSHCFV